MKLHEMTVALVMAAILAFFSAPASSVPLIPGWEEDPLKYQLEVFVICDNLCLRNLRWDWALGTIIEAFNKVNQIMSQLNIEVVVIGLEFWNMYSWINNTGPGMSSDIPKNWMAAKNEYYLNKTYFDDYILLTGLKLDSGFRGKHSLDCMTNSRCNGVVYVPDLPEPITLATVLAHEITHGLGANHDDSCCEYGYGKCIMYSARSPYIERNPVYSSCSKSVVAKYLNSTKSYALRKPVAPATLQLVGAQCGNGIVEKGEECDCGPSCLPSGCCNCCRGCKLTKGAECASGKCCNSSTCKFKEAKTSCRKQRDEACDAEDFCDGKSSECKNEQMADWTNCTDFAGESGYCKNGFCNTINVQCRFVWNQNYKSASESCFTEANEKSDADDYKCKTLICAGNNSDNDFKAGRNPSRPKNSKNVECLVGRYLEVEKAYLGLSGTIMVEDGTKCGTDKACYKGDCISTAEAVAKIESQPVYSRPGYCGNGRIDSGEDCDCGPQQCSCCDLKTCKFKPKDTACLDSCGLCSGTSTNCSTPGSSLSDFKQCRGDFTSMCYNGSCASLKIACSQHFWYSMVAEDLTTANANQNTLTANAGGFIALLNGKNVYQEFKKGEDDGVCGIVRCLSRVDGRGHYIKYEPDGSNVSYPVTRYLLREDDDLTVLYYQPGNRQQLNIENNVDSSSVDISYPLITYDGTPCKLAGGIEGHCRTYTTKSTKYPSVEYYYSKCIEIPTTPTNSRYQFNPFNN